MNEEASQSLVEMRVNNAPELQFSEFNDLTIDIDSDAEKATQESEVKCPFDDFNLNSGNYSIYMNKCRRTQMQDRFSFSKMPNNSDFYAVYDGHGTDKVSDFLSCNMHQYIAHNPKFKSNPQEAIREAFKQIDDDVLKSQELKAEESGCVVLCAIVNKGEMKIANLGDSKAVIYKKDGNWAELSKEHTPSRQDECQRIEQLGGWVLNYRNSLRLQGEINISRAIGDKNYKRFLIPDPEIQEYALQADDAFLILGTDGLWNELSVTEVGKIVKNYVQQEHSLQGESLPQLIFKAAKEKNGTIHDNLTILCVDVQQYRDNNNKEKSSDFEEETKLFQIEEEENNVTISPSNSQSPSNFSGQMATQQYLFTQSKMQKSLIEMENSINNNSNNISNVNSVVYNQQSPLD